MGRTAHRTLLSTNMSRNVLATIALLMLTLTTLHAQTDIHSLTLMGTPLEGPIDSLRPRLKEAQWTEWGGSDDGEDYYYRGKYYGIRAKLMVTIQPATQLVTSAYITVGPYRTMEMLTRNLQYFSNKLQQEHGPLTQHDDARVYMDDYGSIKLSVVDNDNGSHDIRVLYMVEGAYYKDAVAMGLHGPVQEVVTENAISEDQFLHFTREGQLENPDLQERRYDAYGYLRQARMTEKEGYSLVSYEYDDRQRLVSRTLRNPVAGITYINEYRYNADGDIATESQKVMEQDNTCVLTINLRNNYLTRDDHGNWTSKSVSLTYWEQGAQSQQSTVLQKRTISYWE